MKIIYIVTGAFGHLGVNLINELVKKGNQIIAFDLNINKKLFKNNKLVTTIKGDIFNIDDLNSLFSSLNNYKIIVIHCAAIVSIASKYDQKVYDVNVGG